MKKYRLLQIIGGLLIGLSVAVLLVSQLYEDYARQKSAVVVASLQRCLPQRAAGIVQEAGERQMPVLEIQGKDYIALLEVPAVGVILPVQHNWSSRNLLTAPCRFGGSCYDGSMILGAGDKQFDFCCKLDLGDAVVITDMQGREFSYAVQWIERSSAVPYDYLADIEYPLTLFTQEPYSNRYIIVRCGSK